MAIISSTQSLDIRGKTITTFILYKVLERMKAVQEGEVLEIVTEPFEAIDSDLRAWCRLTGQELVDTWILGRKSPSTDSTYVRLLIQSGETETLQW